MADEPSTAAQELYGAASIIAGPSAGPTATVQTTATQTFQVQTASEGVSGVAAGEPQVTPEGQPQDKPTEVPQAGGDGQQTPPSTQQDQTPPPVEGDPVAATQTIQQQLEANKALQQDLTSKGVDFAALEAEYGKTGDISKESREALAKAGYPEQVVNAYISGLKASGEQFANAVFKAAGGQKEFDAIREHTKTLGANAVNAFNAAINSGNVHEISLVLQGLKANMVHSQGTAKPSVLGTKPATQGQAKGFRDKAEMVNAMSDKRYGKDPAYTKAVEERTLLTNF